MASCFQHFSLFLIIHVLITATATATATHDESSLSHEEECLALYQFKQTLHTSFGVDGRQILDSWKVTSSDASDMGDCCSWDGVACSKEEEVIGLDLSESSLQGRINSNTTLFNLVHLQTLNLASNNFSESEIPSEIGRLMQLKSLNLSNSGFSGQIPNEVSHLMHLSSLDLSGNSLQSPSLENLVQNLTRLEQLHLSEVNLSSSVPHFLANFSSLRSLKLRNCYLQNEFPAAILQLPKLKVLTVASNTDLTGSLPEFDNNSLLEVLALYSTNFSGILPKSIINLNHLIFLDLYACSFSGGIPGSLANMTKLTHLGLGGNAFTGLVPSLVGLSQLEFLDLGGNEFEQRRLPDWLGKLSKLSVLYVNDMNLSTEIPPFLANLTKLSDVYMSRNFLSGHIPSSFLNLTQLTYLDLGQNNLQGPIPSSFSNLRSLEYLVLQGNNFSGLVDLDMFLGINQLQTLSLGNNRISIVATNNYTNGTLPQLNTLVLSSCNLKEFPAFLRFQHELTYLSLSHNIIDGLLPEWSWNISQDSLTTIDLSSNFITGFHQHQHQHFLPWVHLETFNMGSNQLQGWIPIPPQTTVSYVVSYNNLSGEIPPMICQVKSLRLLDLGYNNITGILPPCFGSLSNFLEILDLEGNNIQGTMMNTFTQGCLLKRIDLSENQFVGQVSKSLVNCTSLEVLLLADNSFDDVFPYWLGTLAQLQILILRSNKFHGAIQGLTSVSSQFPMLRIIDVSNNGFCGRLPNNYFQTWNAMKSVYVGESSVMQTVVSAGKVDVLCQYRLNITNKGVILEYRRIQTVFVVIDLSCNNFEGEIPESLAHLYGLQSLNLSNNHLVGRVLSSLGNLNNLESLDLSRNKLSGKIPQQLSQLTFLAIWNVSFNHLEGRIPQGNQFDTFDSNSYVGNLGLCGKPLTNECQSSKVSTASQISSDSESLLPSENIDWIIIFTGVGSGLIVGIIIGNSLYGRYSDERKGKRVRSLKAKPGTSSSMLFSS